MLCACVDKVRRDRIIVVFIVAYPALVLQMLALILRRLGDLVDCAALRAPRSPAELELDRDTFEARPIKLTAVQEFGRPIHPALARGQIEGGTAQGLGYALLERVVMKVGNT